MNEQLNRPAMNEAPPSNYLVGAILVTIFCCQILGIVSIIYAAQVNSKWQAGDFDGARRASRNALTWIWVSIGISAVLVVLALIFVIGMAFLGEVFNW